MDENWETSRTSRTTRKRDRSSKAISHNADMHALEESDWAVVPDEPAEQGGAILCGGHGGKGVDQGDLRAIQHEPDTARERVSKGLNGVRQVVSPPNIQR
jgi:hypothetical protein